MSNPWEKISLDDYEKHMSLDSVHQLQTMNLIMKKQFEAYPVETVMVLGIAGGNGLEHVRTDKYQEVYGIDINADYLHEIPGRYPQLLNVLHCLHLDLVNESERLPHAELVIANLLIEYIGYKAFQKAIEQVSPKIISCVIQINTDENQWVSDSPYLHAFDGLDEIHHQMEVDTLTDRMKEIGYSFILKEKKIFQMEKHWYDWIIRFLKLERFCTTSHSNSRFLILQKNALMNWVRNLSLTEGTDSITI